MKLSSILYVLLTVILSLTSALPISADAYILGKSLEPRQSYVSNDDVRSLCDTVAGQAYTATTDNDDRRRRFTRGVVDLFTKNYPTLDILLVHDNANDQFDLPNWAHFDYELETPVFLNPSATIGFQVYYGAQGQNAWYAYKGDGTLINFNYGGCIVSNNANYIAFC